VPKVAIQTLTYCGPLNHPRHSCFELQTLKNKNSCLLLKLNEHCKVGEISLYLCLKKVVSVFMKLKFWTKVIEHTSSVSYMVAVLVKRLHLNYHPGSSKNVKCKVSHFATTKYLTSDSLSTIR
jgi:hypothetical protein